MKCTKCGEEIPESHLLFKFTEFADGEKLDLSFACPNKACRASYYAIIPVTDFITNTDY